MKHLPERHISGGGLSGVAKTVSHCAKQNALSRCARFVLPVDFHYDL